LSVGVFVGVSVAVAVGGSTVGVAVAVGELEEVGVATGVSVAVGNCVGEAVGGVIVIVGVLVGVGVCVGVIVGVGVGQRLAWKSIVRFEPFTVTRSPTITELYLLSEPDSSILPPKPAMLPVNSELLAEVLMMNPLDGSTRFESSSNSSMKALNPSLGPLISMVPVATIVIPRGPISWPDTLTLPIT